MTAYRQIAEEISSALELALPPVAIAFCDELPIGIPHFEGTVAAGCQFWERASSGLFATEAADHRLCSVGVYTQNLKNAPAQQHSELAATLEVMAGLDYVRAEDVVAIPVRSRPAKYAIYGPLINFPIPADAVVLFAQAQQGLILTEAIERVDRAVPLAMGRPACAMIPQVVNANKAVLSFGCCGARAYLDTLNDRTALWALPGSRLREYSEALGTLAGANHVLGNFHLRRKADVAAGETPTVAQSLHRMQDLKP